MAEAPKTLTGDRYFQKLGPRGGTTTVAHTGMVRMTLWLHSDEDQELRKKAFEERRSKSEIMREALRRLLGIED